MRLLHLSTISILACVLGFSALLAFAAWTLKDLRAKRASVVELRELKQRIDEFSGASDSLLVSATAICRRGRRCAARTSSPTWRRRSMA